MAKLYFYYSAMNAGKTTKLLQNNFNYIERGMKTILYTFAGDDRYGAAKITSRIGLSADANIFDNNTNLFEEINKLIINNKIACILIDEAQFLNKKQVKDLCRIVDDLNIPVLTYGLRTDYLGEPFEGSLYLLLWSDELIEVKTICHCGKKATMNAKFNKQGEMITGNNNKIELNNNQQILTSNTLEEDNVDSWGNEMPLPISKNNVNLPSGVSATHQIALGNDIPLPTSANEMSQVDLGHEVNLPSCVSVMNQIALGNEMSRPVSVNEVNQIDIGGNEKYIALCRKHYFMGKLK